MEKTYQPAAIEQHWYKTWEASGYFKPQGSGNPFCIMIPPPNVTGSLHMGHGFQESIMDAFIRLHRMQGDNTLWQVGTDHAGIATQMVVERLLDAEGTSRKQLGRDNFIDRIWAWKAQSGGNITRQLRRLGASADWSRERFTMDEGFDNAVQEVFVRLYRDGLIYRGNRLVNWDPKLHTAISDLEVVNEEEQGHLWHFRYPLADGSGHLVVATTRPETMLGDTAVAVNPDDERYRELIGQSVLLPLTDREIPIIADAYVDPEFGTGCVKITPAHDFNDFEVGVRHGLPMINIFNDNAEINDLAPQAYRGLDRFEARTRVVADLETLGLVEKIEPHKLKVPRGDRSGVVVEPYLTNQWYVKTRPLAEQAIKVVEDGQVKFVPKQYENMYFSWMRDIQDWCISRQLWWGHRIPAWYDPEGKVYVGLDEAAIRRDHNLDEATVLTRDEDVLDTWFSSALWTFGTLGWPDTTPELKTFHPTSVLVTGFDIIFFWVARMIMMTLHFRGEVPFKTVYVHGLVRDSQGQKMSKSKGNVLDPIDLIDGIDLEQLVAKRTTGLMNPKAAPKIEKATRREFPEGIAPYGTDALRYTYYSLASTGRDINFDVGRIEGFRNFCNKLWNASNYVRNSCDGVDFATFADASGTLSSADHWIRSRLESAKQAVLEGFNTYRLDLASQALYDFIWKDYCDWYIELSKPVLWDQTVDPAVLLGTRKTLVGVLEETLRLAHPLMPFITEEIWQKIKPLTGATGETIMLAEYPRPGSFQFAQAAVESIEWTKEFILGVRAIRGELNISASRKVPVLLGKGTADDRRQVDQNKQFLLKLAGLESIAWLEPQAEPPLCSSSFAGALEILVPMAGLIDKHAELNRIDKELAKLEQEIARVSGKLGNDKFVQNAPEEVVQKEREKLAGAKRARQAISESRARLEKL